ncbi:MAG TPA: PDZ domain-containing protein [Gaiellaceae bacterium]|nr:PDZ domain-containing protein [Gaiellaceae bacterium]
MLWLIPSDTWLFIPDNAHPAADVVRVQGEKPQHGPGRIYFLDVQERKARQLEVDFPGLTPDGTSFVPTAEVQPSGANESQTQQFELQQMVTSQQIAGAVALRQLGYKVKISGAGALVQAVEPGAPAQGRLIPGDIIVSVDGTKVTTSGQARALLRKRKPGAKVTLGLRNESGFRTVTLKTIPEPGAPTVPVVGILISQAANIKLPIPVAIDTGNIGGPSAGLAFALEVMQKLGKNVDRGYKIAATGEIFLDGSVGPIGGAEQKAVGARQSGVDIMLAPAGENATTARKYAGHMRVIPVESFRQALHVLATLPPKR